jgi:hypothetical protein
MVGKQLWPFRTITIVWRGQTVASLSSDSRSNPRKLSSKNSCKSLIEIQRSDPKLWPFRTVNLVWRDQTSSSPSIDSTSTPWKRASGNSCKILIAITVRSNVMALFKPLIWSSATRPRPHRESIPHPLLGKQPPKTPVKVWSRSNGRIKSYGCFEPFL